MYFQHSVKKVLYHRSVIETRGVLMCIPLTYAMICYITSFSSVFGTTQGADIPLLFSYMLSVLLKIYYF